MLERPKEDPLPAMELIAAFFEMNDVDRPIMRQGYVLGSRGLYCSSATSETSKGMRKITCGIIYIYPPLCHWKGWSKPGNKADVTTFGVMAHEAGHHIDYKVLGGKAEGHNRWGRFGNHKSITSYAKTCVHEQIAEAARLFILNPEKLAKLSLPSYEFFVKEGLKHGS